MKKGRGIKLTPQEKLASKSPALLGLKNTDLLSELHFYEELNIIKTNYAFRGHAMSYKVEVTEKKDSIKQLEASKSSN